MNAADAISAQYAALADALQHRDSGATREVIADRALAESALSRTRGFTAFTVRIEVTSINVQGETASVQADYTFEGMHRSAGEGPQAFQAVSSAVDTWHFDGSRWHLIREEPTEETQIVN